MTEEQEKAKKWLHDLHPDVKNALIMNYLKEKVKEKLNESK